MGLFLEDIIVAILGLLELAIIVAAVMSWLIAFNVINNRHPVVRQIENFFWAVTRPVLAPFRRIIPPLGAVDITPLIALLVIQAARIYLVPWLFRPIVQLLGG
jgi:YggT family protein